MKENRSNRKVSLSPSALRQSHSIQTLTRTLRLCSQVERSVLTFESLSSSFVLVESTCEIDGFWDSCTSCSGLMAYLTVPALTLSLLQSKNKNDRFSKCHLVAKRGKVWLIVSALITYFAQLALRFGLIYTTYRALGHQVSLLVPLAEVEIWERDERWGNGQTRFALQRKSDAR